MTDDGDFAEARGADRRAGGRGPTSATRTPSSPASSAPTAAGARFLRRLGAEAEDVLDEFLAQALAYEEANTPSLEGFLAWLEVGRDGRSSATPTRSATRCG